jgi:hypothetical protein
MKDGQVDWDSRLPLYDAFSYEVVEIVDTKVTASTVDAMGQVRSGSTSMKGCVFPLVD